MALSFNTDFDPNHGGFVDLAPGLRRVTAANTGPYTFRGTNTYLVGTRSVAIVDPGPDDDIHFNSVIEAVADRPVEAILLTHTHLDHTPLTERLKAATGATIYAIGPHKPYRTLTEQETDQLSRSADLAFRPDEQLEHSDIVDGTDWSLETLFTPGHTGNHASFAIGGTSSLISGDHVMGWSTTVVAPPDGSMNDYLRSLELLLSRPENHYLPGHGAEIPKAHAYVKGLKTHRILRETAILEQVSTGVSSIAQIVKILYRSTPEKLHGAAAMTVLAHLESLVEDGKVIASDTPAKLDSHFSPR